MLKCADCGTLVQDGTTVCGVCGSSRVYPPSQILESNQNFQLRPVKGSRTKAFLILAISVALLAGGFAISVSSGYAFGSATSLAVSLIGLFMIVFGFVMLIGAVSGSIGGGFRYRTGLRHSGEAMRRADQERERREKREDTD